MTGPAQDLLARWLAPFRTRVGWWLAAVNGLIVGAVLSAMLYVVADAMRDTLDRRDRATALLGGATAREDLRRTAVDLLGSARVLGERPTLLRLLQEDRPDAIRAFIGRYCSSVRASACAVDVAGGRLIEWGATTDWSQARAAVAEQGERFMLTPVEGAPLLGATARVGGHAATVLVLRALDAPLVAEISQRIGFPVRTLNYRQLESAPVDVATPVHAAALADGNAAVEAIDARQRYLASYPVYASTGEPIALLEVTHSAAESRQIVAALLRNFILLALLLTSAAVLTAIWLGRRVTKPIEALTESARRLGVGDFSTPVPVLGVNEVAILGRTVEEMRRSLLDASAALRRRDAEAQAMLRGIVEGLFAVDMERKVRYLNPQAARLLQVDAPSSVGQFCGDVLRPEPVAGERPCDTNCPILQARAAGVAQCSERLRRASGESRTMIVTSTAPVDALQVQVIRDETDMEAVRRARDSVLAHISHEFRTPLAAQQASIEMLRDAIDGGADAAQLRTLLAALSRGTLRLTQLIDNLLESVRIESGHLTIRHRRCDLADALDEAVETTAPLMEQRHQTLQRDYASPLELTADPPRLVQVIVNLLANASKFAPDGTTIIIGARDADGSIEFWVDDSGPGIPPESADRIFDRFSRGAGEEPATAGLGLGLWIARSIVQRHGGTILPTRSAAGLNRFLVHLPKEAST